VLDDGLVSVLIAMHYWFSLTYIGHYNIYDYDDYYCWNYFSFLTVFISLTPLTGNKTGTGHAADILCSSGNMA